MSFMDVVKTVAAPQYAAVQAAKDTLKGKKGTPGAPGRTTIIRERSGGTAPGLTPPPLKPWYTHPVTLALGVAVLLGGFLVMRRRQTPAAANPRRRRRRRR